MSDEFGQSLDLFGEIIAGQSRRGVVPPLRAQHLYPSSASVMLEKHPYTGGRQAVGGCLRRQYLQYLLEPQSDEGFVTEDIGPAEVGNLLQDYVEKELFEKADLFLQSELQIYLPQWNVSGRADTILKKDTIVVPVEDSNGNTVYRDVLDLEVGDQVNGQPYTYREKIGVEVKSKDGYMAQKSYIRKNKSDDPKSFRPQDEHIMQAMIYLYAFNMIPALKKHNVKKWFIFYVLRENGKYNYFELTMTDENSQHGPGWPKLSSYVNPTPFVYKRFNMSDIIERWEELNFCLDNKILPDRDYKLIYDPNDLTARVNNNYPYLGKDNKLKIQQGRFSEVVFAKGTANERAVGDFECYACPYKSKCWGLQNKQAEQFDCVQNPDMSTRTKYSEFDPFKSHYFDKLDDSTKDDVRVEIGKDLLSKEENDT